MLWPNNGKDARFYQYLDFPASFFTAFFMMFYSQCFDAHCMPFSFLSYGVFYTMRWGWRIV